MIFIARRELGRLLRGATLRIGVPVFLVLSAAYMFILSPFFATGRATLEPFFEFAPLLLLFLGPALTMQTIAEEARSGTLDVLQSWPVSSLQIIWGKFFAVWSVLGLTLLFTLAQPGAVSWMGDLDWGPVGSGYLGLSLAGGANLAIGLAASAFARSQLTAFLVAFLIGFLLYIVGRAAPMLPSQAASICEFLSFETHLNGFSKGLIDSRHVLFFLSVIVLALSFAVEGLRSRRW